MHRKHPGAFLLFASIIVAFIILFLIPNINLGQAIATPHYKSIPLPHAIREQCTDFDGDGELPRYCGGIDCDDLRRHINNADKDGDGQSSCAGDCNDNDAFIRTGLLDLCDLKDNDCDGLVDEDC